MFFKETKWHILKPCQNQYLKQFSHFTIFHRCIVHKSRKPEPALIETTFSYFYNSGFCVDYHRCTFLFYYCMLLLRLHNLLTIPLYDEKKKKEKRKILQNCPCGERLKWFGVELYSATLIALTLKTCTYTIDNTCILASPV